ncbi:hypothetical protein ACP4OV_018584 [Aristida adscensionis]
MATRPATAAATTAVGRLPALHGPLRVGLKTAVSFPLRSTVALSLSISSSCPASPAPPAANPKYHNAKADAGDDEGADGEELLRRFTREVARARVMEEVRRRRRHEDARDRRKRKARSAARRFRRRHFKGPYPFDDEQGSKEQMSDDDANDNWELPGGQFPSYR